MPGMNNICQCVDFNKTIQICKKCNRNTRYHSINCTYHSSPSECTNNYDYIELCEICGKNAFCDCEQDNVFIVDELDISNGKAICTECGRHILELLHLDISGIKYPKLHLRLWRNYLSLISDVSLKICSKCTQSQSICQCAFQTFISNHSAEYYATLRSKEKKILENKLEMCQSNIKYYKYNLNQFEHTNILLRKKIKKIDSEIDEHWNKLTE